MYIIMTVGQGEKIWKSGREGVSIKYGGGEMAEMDFSQIYFELIYGPIGLIWGWLIFNRDKPLKKYFKKAVQSHL